MLVNKLKSLRNGADEEGFTLIELMIVVVIIGILAAVAIPIFMNQQAEAIKSGVKSDVRNTVTSVATYLVSNPTATSVASVTPTQTDGNTLSVTGSWNNYTVIGTATGVGTWAYRFLSTTGKYQAGNLATAGNLTSTFTPA